jgi:hypothetical protein
MGWCGSSTPGTPEFQTMNEEGHKCTKGILANDYEALILKRTPKGCPFQVENPPLPFYPTKRHGRDFGFIVSCCQTIEQIK